MKFTKSFLAAAFGIAVAMGVAAPTMAQTIGVYAPGPFAGGTVVIPQFTTNTFYVYSLTNGVQNGTITTNTYSAVPTGGNTNLTVNVAGYENVGITLQFTESAYNTNSPVGLVVYRSGNYGVTFETTPYQSFTNILLAASAPYTYTLFTNVPCYGASTLGFSFINIPNPSGVVGYVTNALLNVTLKGNTVQTVPAGISIGNNPFKPIGNTNFGN
jgi:hypothetical protein